MCRSKSRLAQLSNYTTFLYGAGDGVCVCHVIYIPGSKRVRRVMHIPLIFPNVFFLVTVICIYNRPNHDWIFVYLSSVMNSVKFTLNVNDCARTYWARIYRSLGVLSNPLLQSLFSFHFFKTSSTCNFAAIWSWINVD